MMCKGEARAFANRTPKVVAQEIATERKRRPTPLGRGSMSCTLAPNPTSRRYSQALLLNVEWPGS